MLQQIKRSSMPRVSNVALSNIRWVIIAGTSIFLIVTLLQISLIGKNLTYASRFTPPSTQKDILNRTYHVESQVLMLFFLTMHAFSVAGLAYLTMNRGLRAFLLGSGIKNIIIVAATLAQNIILFIICLYFLSGASQYRNYLNQLGQQINSTEGYCTKNTCQVSACVRIWSFYLARNMTISFLVIGEICFATILPLSFVFNRGKKNMNNLELLV